MKSIIILFFLFQSNYLFSSPIEVKNHSNSNEQTKSKKKKVLKKSNQSEENSDLNEVTKIDQESSKVIKSFLAKNSFAVWDFTNSYDVKTGTAIKGILLNSVVSSNQDSPILVEISENYAGILKGSKLSCVGATKNKRVITACNKLITDNDEYEVDTILLNPDGTAGLLGKTYSGREQYAVGAITAAALKSALDVSMDRVTTTSGLESVTTNSRNKIKGGSIGAMDEIIQMNTDEYKALEPKISIDAGKSVLVYFNRRFKL